MSRSLHRAPTQRCPSASALQQCGLRIDPQLRLLTQTLAVSVLLSALWVLWVVLNQLRPGSWRGPGQKPGAGKMVPSCHAPALE